MDENLQLRRQVCFALYAASRAVTGLYRPHLDRLGLTYPQYLVMLVLWEHGATTVKDLGTALQLDSGTLSPLLRRLEATGLVSRRRRAEDERSVEVGLTEAGEALRQQAHSLPERIAMATGLSAQELAALHQTLVRLADSVTSAADGHPPKS